MPPLDTALEVNEYRLVLVKSGSDAIWAERRGHDLCLPRLVISRWTRPAEQLQEGVEAAWHLRAIVLDFLPIRKDSLPLAVAEIISSELPYGLTAASIDALSDAEVDVEERSVVHEILAGDPGVRGPFSRVGWIQDAMEWMRAEVGHDIAFAGEIRQYNASASFALVRFTTQSGPAYWLKATGEPNTHEFHITKLLSELCPEFLPQRVAERRDWNAWLMEDAGRSLDFWPLPALEQAVSSMAELQKRTVGRTGIFLDAGAFDQRLLVLHTHLAELVEYLEEAMMKQSSTKVPRIERRRLWQMASIIQDACLCMEVLEIPETLVHNDMNSGNILFQGTQCVFTDWCEIGVGNPFFTLQYLCLLQPRGEEDRTPRLRELCGKYWLDHLSASQIEKALALMPLLAILSYLYGRGTWLHSVRRNDPHVESCARSLARDMDRAAQDPRLLDVLCR